MLLVHPLPGMALTEMRDAATAFAAHGWPIYPGEFLRHSTDAETFGITPPAVRPVPGKHPGPLDVDQAFLAWTEHSWPILLSPDRSCGVFDLDPPVDRRVVDVLREAGCLGPIVVDPRRGWHVLARLGHDAADSVTTVRAAEPRPARDYLVLAPTGTGSWTFRWRVSPAEVGWVLPCSAAVGAVLAHHHHHHHQPPVDALSEQEVGRCR